MATSKDTAEYILDCLGDRRTFTVRSMFGEFALYVNGKTVGFICDDTLFIKILPASAALESQCEKGPAYPGSKPYYIIDESLFNDSEFHLLLMNIAASIRDKPKK